MDRVKIAGELVRMARQLVGGAEHIDEDALTLIKQENVQVTKRDIKKLVDKYSKKIDRKVAKVVKMAEALGWKGRVRSYADSFQPMEPMWVYVDDLEYERMLGRGHEDAWTEDAGEDALKKKKRAIEDAIVKIEDSDDVYKVNVFKIALDEIDW